MEQWSTGLRGAGGQGPGAAYLRRTQAQGTGLPPTPPLPCATSHVWAVGLDGTCRRQGPGEKRGPLGFIQVAFRSRPVRGGAHGVQGSTHRAPAMRPIGWR